MIATPLQRSIFMKFLYEKFWVPFFGNILNKFVYLIEGKNKKDKV